MLSAKIIVGNLDKRVTIIYPDVETSDVTNEDIIPSWVELVTVWGKVKAFSGNEAMIAERLTETHNINIDVRYRTDITIRMRAVVDSRVYDIVSITPMEDRNRFMTLVCQLNDKAQWS